VPVPHRRLAVSLLLLLALALRTVGLADQPIHADEAMHLHPRAAVDVLTFDLMFNPPLFRVVTAAACAIERTVTASRVVPVLAGTLSVLLLYLLGLKTVGARPALLASFLLAVHPWHIRHSQTVRCFVLLSFLVLLAAVLADRRKGKTGWDTGAAAAGGLAMLTHYLAFAQAAVESVRSLASGRRRAAAAYALPLVAVAGALLPFLLPGTARKVAAGSVAYENGLLFLLSLIRATFTPGGLSLVAAVLLAGLGATVREARPLLLPPITWIAATLAAGLAIPIEIRYSLPALPFLLLLAATGACAWWGSSAPEPSQGGCGDSPRHGVRGAPGARSAPDSQGAAGVGRPRWRRIGAAVATLLLAAGVVRPLPDYYRCPSEPAPALAIHPDLAHVEVDLRPLAAELRQASAAAEPIFVAVRGPFHYRLAAELSLGRYPDNARLAESNDITVFEAGTMRLVTAAPDSPELRPDRPGTPAAGKARGPCLLLREHVFPCTPAEGCVPAVSSSNADLLRCPQDSCARFPCTVGQLGRVTGVGLAGQPLQIADCRRRIEN